MAKVLFLSAMFCLSCITLASQELDINLNDLRIEQSIEGGYYLYIRKTESINSVLITESTEDPDRQVASYALRNPEFHPENGEELRVLNGEVITSDGLYFLVDSSPVADSEFGMAFRIFIPYVVVFGYNWSRNGEIQVLDGTYLNIRTFPLPFADYSGGFQDNPFTIRVTQVPSTGPALENYSEDTINSFSAIAANTDGLVLYSEGEEDILNQVASILAAERGNSLDLAIVIDSTHSMKNDLPFLQANLARVIDQNTKGFSTIRIGFVNYRDYREDYLYQVQAFKLGTDHIDAILASIQPAGGRDIPEAVNEAIYAALSELDWRADNRKIILIGDAPPHPRPRGEVTPELVDLEAENKNVAVHVIILPH